MPQNIDKRVVTPDDILSAFTLPNPGGVQTRPQLKLAIVSGVWKVERVYDPRTAAWYIKGTQFDQLLAEMADDGRIVMMEGWDLEKLTDRIHVTRSWGYYMLPERAEELRKQGADREREKREAEADRFAREHLVIRHRREYDELVEEYHNGARLVDQEQGQ
ncbi:hypothetical protein [Streptomyces mirabilis]|uniref:hypothetical protein n=1 Tax=Streptomyces mirabilis TaxID=68239 RepID=UPI0036A80146